MIIASLDCEEQTLWYVLPECNQVTSGGFAGGGAQWHFGGLNEEGKCTIVNCVEYQLLFSGSHFCSGIW